MAKIYETLESQSSGNSRCHSSVAGKHYKSAPFIGIILAGEFTAPARSQLESLGFALLSIPTESIVKAFRKFGMDAAADETTTDAHFKIQIQKYESLSVEKRNRLGSILFCEHEAELKAFSDRLGRALSRQITHVIVLSLHGTPVEVSSLEEALVIVKAPRPNLATHLFFVLKSRSLR